jgi:hypothetical protein
MSKGYAVATKVGVSRAEPALLAFHFRDYMELCR